MQILLFIVLSLAFASATVEVASVADYHRRVAIPLAAKIKAAEDAILADQDARIIGGNVAPTNAHPYMGGLLITYLNHPNTGVCGSSLVSHDRLVTAAHCWVDEVLQASRFVVVLGSDYLYSGGERIATSKVTLYPGWKPGNTVNDLAVICLPKLVVLSDSIQPILLASNSSNTYAGQWAVTAGYGSTIDDQPTVDVKTVLRELRKQVITVDQCRDAYGSIATDNTICTNGTNNVGICWGDDGGPLAVTRNGTPLLIGISAFGPAYGCGHGNPSGFLRITSYVDYINSLL